MRRSAKEILIASREYASENRTASWWYLWSTMGLFILLATLASLGSTWIVSLSSSFLAGLVLVRCFVLYHDFLHGAILRNSKVANLVMHAYGTFVLSPPDVWKHTHDDHHKNNCRYFGEELGTFPIMTTCEYARSGFARRVGYRIVRNPLVIVFGYLTSFCYNKCVRNFFRDPVKYRTAGIALVLHAGLAVAIGFISAQALLLGMLLPLAIGSAAGTYLFYAQHNFPGVRRATREDWNHVDAALLSSSYMEMGPIMNWLTGNIGYHHVHHLNAKIPFYRLPQAMRGIVELQNPTTTSLKPVDVYRCLRLKLWDTVEERMVSFREAASLNRGAPSKVPVHGGS